MTKRNRERDAAIAACMALAAERGWRRLALAEIAGRAGLPLVELVREFPDRAAIFDAYLRGLDEKMLAGAPEPGISVRDRLFEVLMRRFEAMAPDRRALSAILRESGDDPWSLVRGARRFMRAMGLALEAAGVSASGLGGLARTEALALLYLSVLRVFLNDETEDLSRTMAALDKALRRAEGAVRMMRGSVPTFTSGPAATEGGP